MSGHHDDRRQLTFEQAEGAEPLPSQLALKEISPQLRSLLWAAVLESLNGSRGTSMYATAFVKDPWRTILYEKHVFRDHLMADEFSESFDDAEKNLKPIFQRGDYIKVLGFAEWLIRHRKCPPRLIDRIGAALRESRAAYGVINRNTIVPIGSEAERQTLERAFADLASSEFHGARAHLRSAATALTQGKFPDSVRESIHAVESIARVLEPSADLSRALGRLEASANIHGAMKSGFLKLYGFASDENGIRHPLLDRGDASVDEMDALFMIGACAAFLTYLVGRGRQAGLIKPTDRGGIVVGS